MLRLVSILFLTLMLPGGALAAEVVAQPTNTHMPVGGETTVNVALVLAEGESASALELKLDLTGLDDLDAEAAFR